MHRGDEARGLHSTSARRALPGAATFIRGPERSEAGAWHAVGVSEDLMSTFRHPFMTRGIVRIGNGAYPVSRGLVVLPEEIGESLGWRKVESDELPPQSRLRQVSPNDQTPTRQ